VNSFTYSLLILLIHSFTNRFRSTDADIVHTTFYLPGYLNRFPKNIKVTTLYDMIPENTKREKRFWNPHFSKRRYLSKSDLVLSISDSTTRDMLSEYELDIVVPTTYPGVGCEFTANLPKLEFLPAEYFLFVGNRGGYKSFNLALEAFASMAKEFPNLDFLLVGGGKLSRSETKLVKSLHISPRVHQRHVTSSELPNVYSNATALIYPSTYEGFGLPLVEAMASGTCIIASDTEVNKEIGGACANYFPIGDKNALMSEMRNVMLNQEAYQSKILKGLERSLEFTWLKCAEKTAEEYKKLLRLERAQ